MSATGLEVFDKTVQTTTLWLEEINCSDPDQVANVRGALSKPVRRLWPDSATDLKEQATQRREQTLERTEP